MKAPKGAKMDDLMWRPESNEKYIKPTPKPYELFKQAEPKDASLPR